MMAEIPESCHTWNAYIDARKQYGRTQDPADLREADRLYRLHHQQILQECTRRETCPLKDGGQ